MNKIMCAIIILFMVFVCSSLGQRSTGEDEISELLNACTRRCDSNQTVYFGWPTDISCVKLSVEYHSGLTEEQEGNLQGIITSCTVRVISSAKVMHNVSFSYRPYFFDREEDVVNSTFYTEDITEDTPGTYVVQFTIADHCSYQIVQLHKTTVVNPSCEDEDYPKVKSFQADQGELIRPSCDIYEPILKHLDSAGSLTYKWLYNCGEKMGDNVSPSRHRLVITNTSYSNAGKYICIIIYKGQEMYNLRRDVCVEYRTTADQGITIECPEILQVKIGNSIQVKCHADLGIGKANGILVSSKWTRAENASAEICETMSDFNSTSDARIDCFAKSSVDRWDCYDGANPPPDEPPHDEYQVIMNVRDISASHLGSYTMKFSYTTDNVHFRNITLVEDRTEILVGEIVAITVGVVFLFLTLVVILLCVWRKHDVLWYWKKHFGYFEKEIHTYTAYLAYYYDTDPGKMGDKSRIHTETLVSNIETFMEKYHGTTYNEHKEVSKDQYDANNIIQLMAECHRIIIILSPEYIVDHWSTHTTHQALHEVVETGRKLIFITIPGAKKAISVADIETRRTLQSAMKRNITIGWSGKVPFTGTFRRRLEYALPKLPPPRYNRCLSDSSEAQLTMRIRHAARSVSVKHQATTTQMASKPYDDEKNMTHR